MKQGEGQFGQTRWTSVLKAADLGAPGSADALRRLCEDYRPPILRFALGLGMSREDAEDLTQGFFAHFIAHNLPSAASPEKGRFRTFLLTAFKNHRVSEWRKLNRAKDIPRALTVSADEEREDGRPMIEPVAENRDDGDMDLLWAQSIRDRVIKQMAWSYSEPKRARFFRRMGCLLLGRAPEKSHEEISADLGINENLLKQNVFRMRKEFREAFRAEVAETVFDPADVEAEYRHLASLLFSSPEESPASVE